MKSNHGHYMQISIEEALKCPNDQQRVGVVFVKGGELIARTYRGSQGDNKHAEQCALEIIAKNGLNPKNATVYVTLEPCNRLVSKNKVPCAQQLIAAGVKAVYIGAYDINPAIYRQGWKALRDAGVELHDYDETNRTLAKQLNEGAMQHFKYGIGPTGGAKFDHKQNGGNFIIYTDETKKHKIQTGWGERGADSIYANAGVPGLVALAKYAQEFNEIDDPRAYDYGSHFAEASIGDIVIFRNGSDYALIKLLDVHAGPTRGASDTYVKIQYEVRTITD